MRFVRAGCLWNVKEVPLDEETRRKRQRQCFWVVGVTSQRSKRVYLHCHWVQWIWPHQLVWRNWCLGTGRPHNPQTSVTIPGGLTTHNTGVMVPGGLITHRPVSRYQEASQPTDLRSLGTGPTTFTWRPQVGQLGSPGRMRTGGTSTQRPHPFQLSLVVQLEASGYRYPQTWGLWIPLHRSYPEVWWICWQQKDNG